MTLVVGSRVDGGACGADIGSAERVRPVPGAVAACRGLMRLLFDQAEGEFGHSGRR